MISNKLPRLSAGGTSPYFPQSSPLPMKPPSQHDASSNSAIFNASSQQAVKHHFDVEPQERIGRKEGGKVGVHEGKLKSPFHQRTEPPSSSSLTPRSSFTNHGAAYNKALEKCEEQIHDEYFTFRHREETKKREKYLLRKSLFEKYKTPSLQRGRRSLSNQGSHRGTSEGGVKQKRSLSTQRVEKAVQFDISPTRDEIIQTTSILSPISEYPKSLPNNNERRFEVFLNSKKKKKRSNIQRLSFEEPVTPTRNRNTEGTSGSGTDSSEREILLPASDDKKQVGEGLVRSPSTHSKRRSYVFSPFCHAAEGNSSFGEGPIRFATYHVDPNPSALKLYSSLPISVASFTNENLLLNKNKDSPHLNEYLQELAQPRPWVPYGSSSTGKKKRKEEKKEGAIREKQEPIPGDRCASTAMQVWTKPAVVGSTAVSTLIDKKSPERYVSPFEIQSVFRKIQLSACWELWHNHYCRSRVRSLQRQHMKCDVLHFWIGKTRQGRCAARWRRVTLLRKTFKKLKRVASFIYTVLKARRLLQHNKRRRLFLKWNRKTKQLENVHEMRQCRSTCQLSNVFQEWKLQLLAKKNFRLAMEKKFFPLWRRKLRLKQIQHVFDKMKKKKLFWIWVRSYSESLQEELVAHRHFNQRLAQRYFKTWEFGVMQRFQLQRMADIMAQTKKIQLKRAAWIRWADRALARKTQRSLARWNRAQRDFFLAKAATSSS